MDKFLHLGWLLILTGRNFVEAYQSLSRKKSSVLVRKLNGWNLIDVDSLIRTPPPNGLIFSGPPIPRVTTIFFWWSSGCKQVPLAHLWYFCHVRTFLEWAFDANMKKTIHLAEARSSGLHRCPQSSWCQKGPREDIAPMLQLEGTCLKTICILIQQIWYDMMSVIDIR